MSSIALFGAGPALGLSLARRYASAGYDVALVARDPDKLARLERELADAPGAVATFVADLADRERVRATIAAIRERFDLPDVVVYAPGDVTKLPVSALALDPEELERWLPLHLLSPLALGAAVLPDMTRRGSGAFIVAQGTMASTPQAPFASVGAAQAALRNWAHGAAQEAGEHGVLVATLTIHGLIERSAAASLFDQGHFDEVERNALPRHDPDELAERIWDLIAKRDRVDLVV